jgi:tryptophanyl-tRNA synthetase
MTEATAKKETILSGMQPTGALHIGNLEGALRNWVRLQNDYWMFCCVVDWHALTADYENTAVLKERIFQMTIDWLAAGLDPEKCAMFIQSDVKEHAELHLLLSMLITVARLERNPTLKEQARDLELGENITYGHLGYPVLQAADILIYKAGVVPVGEDQLPHLEITREIARRFNGLYGEVFPVPEPLLTEFARLPGLDGKRMSKSLGNAILMSDPPEVIAKKVSTAITDPEKIRMGDPGHPDVCNVYAYHRRFNPQAVPEIRAGCVQGTRGCVACKKEAGSVISEFLSPMRERRHRLEADMAGLVKMLNDGAERAREVARATMAEVRRAMGVGR